MKKIERRIAKITSALMLAIILPLTLPGTVHAARQVRVYDTGASQLLLRKSPDLNSSEGVGVLIPDWEIITITDEVGGCGYTTYGGKSGWVRLRYTQVLGDYPSQEPMDGTGITPTWYTIYNTGNNGVTLRIAPTDECSTFGYMMEGTEILIEAIQDGWGYTTTYAGHHGWARMDNLIESSNYPGWPEAETPGQQEQPRVNQDENGWVVAPEQENNEDSGYVIVTDEVANNQELLDLLVTSRGSYDYQDPASVDQLLWHILDQNTTVEWDNYPLKTPVDTSNLAEYEIPESCLIVFTKNILHMTDEALAAFKNEVLENEYYCSSLEEYNNSTSGRYYYDGSAYHVHNLFQRLGTWGPEILSATQKDGTYEIDFLMGYGESMEKKLYHALVGLEELGDESYWTLYSVKQG